MRRIRADPAGDHRGGGDDLDSRRGSWRVWGDGQRRERGWRRHGWRRSIETVELATLEWVDWFNHRRLLEPIGYMPPAEAEANYYAALEQYAMAA